MTTVYTVASAKGGVGKTTTAANLSAALAAAGHGTVVVDGDIGTPNLASALGVAVPEGGATLHDVLAGEADPVEATYEGPHGLAVVPGGRTLDAFRAADPAGITDVVAAITGAEYVVVDTGAGVTHGSVLPLSIADEVLLVSTPTRDALADTRRTLDVAERLGGSVAGLALTRTGGDAARASDGDPAGVDAPVLGEIPEASVVPAAAAAGEPLSTFAPEDDAAAAYRDLAAALTGDAVGVPADDDPDPIGSPDGQEDAVADGGDDTPTPRPLDDDTEPAITPLDDPVDVVEAEPMDGDADAVDAPRTVLGEVIDGPVSAADGSEEDPTDGDRRPSGRFLGRLFG